MRKCVIFLMPICTMAFVLAGVVQAELGAGGEQQKGMEFGPVPEQSQIAQLARSNASFGVSVADHLSSTVATGTITGWPESGFHFVFDDHVGVTSDVEGWWSINTLTPPRGWFYGYNETTEVAHVTGIRDICEISDASTYTYDSWSVGPVYVGDHVLFHNVSTNYYAAFRVDDIYGPDALSSMADVTWYLQEDGSANFGPCHFLTVSPPSGDYVSTQSFDLTFIVDAPALSVVGGLVTLDGNDVTSVFSGCAIRGTLVSGGQTFRCPGLLGSGLGVGSHRLEVRLDMSDGSQLTDTATWVVKENREP